MTGERSSRVVVDLPPWLYGGRPRDFLTAASLHGRERAGKWQIQTDESYYRRPPDLLGHYDIVAPGQLSGDWGQFSWAEHVPTDLSIPQELRPDLSGEPRLIDLLNVLAIEVAQAPSDRVGVLAEEVLEQVRTFVDAKGDHLLEQASLHVVAARPAFLWRLTLARLQFRLLIDPDHDLRRAKKAVQSGPVLRSSEALLDGSRLLSPYMAPLMGAVSPSVWGHASVIPGVGTLVLGFGCALNGGLKPLPATLLGTIYTKTPTRARRAHVTADNIVAAIAWWGDALNRLFGVLTDPTTFADGDGSYNPVKHAHALMTIEHLFRRVTAIQTAYENTEATLALFFSAMDTFERLLGKKADTLYSPLKARDVLDRLERDLPAQAAPLILQGARRGVDALEAVEQGFFLPDEHGRIPQGTDKNGHRKSRTPREAVAVYLTLRRNAIHGFDPPKGSNVAVSGELLGRHTGALPDDLPLLAYLYLLDLLTSEPDRLRRTLC